MFRFRHSNSSLYPASSIDEVVSVSKFDKQGVEHVSFVSQPCSVNADTIPCCADYTLSALLAAGVPLTPVSVDSSLSPSDSAIDAFVSQLDGVDSDSYNI